MEETLDITPTPAGTLRLWAAVLSGAKDNIERRNYGVAKSMIEEIVQDLLANANKLS
jgi:hypothetical protein